MNSRFSRALGGFLRHKKPGPLDGNCRPARRRKAYRRPNELFRILKGYGYNAYIFDGKQNQERSAGRWSVNYLFLQPSHLVRLGLYDGTSASFLNISA